ncbi:MAG: hypothetical protein KAX65_11420 [Caldilineaceae bacterium]|nr:hypothetical protein [Caldilineaceae bacterium]
MIARRSTCPNCGQEMYRTDTAADAGRTHWPECWRDRQHHACAVAQVEQARADAAQWRARYMAAHDVLLAVEDYIESAVPVPGMNGSMSATSSTKFNAMSAAFHAYRAAVEAGAPLGWAVAPDLAEIQRGIVPAAEFRAMMQGDAEQQQPNAKAQRGEGAEEGQG